MNTTAVSLEEGRRVTERVCAEVRCARRVWAHFEAINGEAGETREGLRRGVDYFDLGYPLQSLQKALVRDTLMSLFRATDGQGRGRSRLTFGRLSDLLRCKELRDNRLVSARDWCSATSPELQTLNEADCASWMQVIIDTAPPEWNAKQPPPDRRLFDLRQSLKDVRDGTLAHAMENEGNVVIKEIRSFIEVTTDLASHAQVIFLDQAQSWQSDWSLTLRQANAFWDRCQQGFEERHP